MHTVFSEADILCSSRETQMNTQLCDATHPSFTFATQRSQCHIKIKLHGGMRWGINYSCSFQAYLLVEFAADWLFDLSLLFRRWSEAPSLQRVCSQWQRRRPSTLPPHASHFSRWRLAYCQWTATPLHTVSPYTSRSTGLPQWAPIWKQVQLISSWCQFAFSMHCLPTFNLSDRCQPT